MSEHAWTVIDNGQACFCARCGMRVDNDEFVPGVEDSLCVPQAVVGSVATADIIVADADEMGVDLGAPGGDRSVTFVAHDEVQYEEPPVRNDAADAMALTWTTKKPHELSLVEFVEFAGMKEVSPWQLQMLGEIDKDVRRKRGLPYRR